MSLTNMYRYMYPDIQNEHTVIIWRKWKHHWFHLHIKYKVAISIITLLYFAFNKNKSGDSPGTLQSSNINSDVFEPLIPSLSSLIPVLKPGIP